MNWSYCCGYICFWKLVNPLANITGFLSRQYVHASSLLHLVGLIRRRYSACSIRMEQAVLCKQVAAIGQLLCSHTGQSFGRDVYSFFGIIYIVIDTITFYDAFDRNLIHWLNHLLDKFNLIFIKFVFTIELFIYVCNALSPVDVAVRREVLERDKTEIITRNIHRYKRL